MTNFNKVAAASISTLLTSFIVLGSAGFIYVVDGISAETLMCFMIGGLSGFGVGMVGTVGCIIYDECHPRSLERQNERAFLMPPPIIQLQILVTHLSPLPAARPVFSTSTATKLKL